MKKLLAVSGGIDSMAMLHLFRNEKDVIVVHFNHGIRPNSDDDEKFVERIAGSYNLPFVSKKNKLGEDCSEEKARDARYAFLRSLMDGKEDKIYTAHHADDMCESAVINLLRGTGWRGLAPLRAKDIERPLINWTKKDIYKYATENNIRFRQDQSNTEGNYLRNRVREKLQTIDKRGLEEIILKQRMLADEIEAILDEIAPRTAKISKKSLSIPDRKVQQEILREFLRPYVSLTRPQLERTVEAIEELKPGKRFSLSKDYFLLVGKYFIEVEKVNKG